MSFNIGNYSKTIVRVDNNNKVDAQFTKRDIIIAVNHKIAAKNDNFIELSGGIGVSLISLDGTTIRWNNSSGLYTSILDSGNMHMVCPNFNISAEYIAHFSSNTHWYYGIKANLQYVYLLSDAKGYISAGNEVIAADYSGHLFNPSLFISIHYMLKRKEY